MPHAFAPSCGPLAFDFHAACASRRPLEEAAPLPIFGPRHQLSLHRIAMHVAQFFYALALAPHREVIIPNLPEARLIASAELARGDLLEHLDGHGELRAAGFADEQVHMLRHDDIAGYVKSVPSADALQFALQDFAGLGAGEEFLPPVAAERYEMQATLLLKALQSRRHAADILLPPCRSKTRSDKGGSPTAFLIREDGPAPRIQLDIPPNPN